VTLKFQTKEFYLYRQIYIKSLGSILVDWKKVRIPNAKYLLQKQSESSIQRSDYCKILFKKFLQNSPLLDCNWYSTSKCLAWTVKLLVEIYSGRILNAIFIKFFLFQFLLKNSWRKWLKFGMCIKITIGSYECCHSRI